MNEKPTSTTASTPKGGQILLLFLLPIILLAGVITLFIKTNGAGLKVDPVAPIEKLVFERTVLKEHRIELYVRNESPQEIVLAAININDAIWPFKARPSATIPRLRSAVVSLDYDWLPAEAYRITLFSTNAVAFNTEIAAATLTPKMDVKTFWSFSLIGLYIGVIPIFLGLLWFPVMRRLSTASVVFIIAATGGLLLFLGVDAIHEALELTNSIGESFQGVGIVAIGTVVSFLLLEALSQRQRRQGRSEAEQRLSLAFLISTGIGLHNLGEGLAIGAAYSVGAASLGTFLVVGFIIQNLTEGLGIIAPILRDRPRWGQLALMGLMAGLPANIGCYLGGFNPFTPLAVFFLAVGAGAVLQVAWEMARLLQKQTVEEPQPFPVFFGITTGMAILWVTGLLIK